MTIKVDKNKCIGCGVCAAICDEVFELGEDGKSYVKKGKEKSKDPTVDEAIESCPVEAIEKR